MTTKQWDFWNGPDLEDRRIKYADEFKPEYQENGDLVQRKIAAVVQAFLGETQIALPEGYASGWRPAGVNEATSNAAQHSSHLIAAAGDKRDTPNGDFAWWCMRNPGVLEQHGLYMEHPVATVLRSYKTAKAASRTPTPWCHLSTVAPHSHLRCYFPDLKAGPEWDAFTKAGGYAGITYDDWLKLQAPTLEQVVAANEHDEGDDHVV